MGHHNDLNEPSAEVGVVVQVNQDTIWIERTTLDGCKSCSMSGVCGSSNQAQLEFPNNDNYQLGDLVDIHIASSTRLLSSFIVFILPILIFISTFSLSFYVFHYSEPLSIGLSFLSLIIAFGAILVFDRLLAKKNVIRIVKKD
ncbi:MAG: SoxR reducing system RseC family protein [Candidatus Cloacimonadales bacterium]|jgi:sigma-E factor negative regulatory protein RseC|nr:SoxR reducing system RseC family protein [Candidatus Cloacimonadota bacterium]MDD2649748.1 SoxR reducing system RseC family protein [Candidatus Cloacimonadota bacterium]MDX9977582.1 SoxR reducing system RseC family protein [Candidatus Cloacimonadales bacterium]